MYYSPLSLLSHMFFSLRRSIVFPFLLCRILVVVRLLFLPKDFSVVPADTSLLYDTLSRATVHVYVNFLANLYFLLFLFSLIVFVFPSCLLLTVFPLTLLPVFPPCITHRLYSLLQTAALLFIFSYVSLKTSHAPSLLLLLCSRRHSCCCS